MRPSSKSAKAAVIGLGVLALVAAWIGFQLGTHRHTGILRTLTQEKRFLSEGSASSKVNRRAQAHQAARNITSICLGKPAPPQSLGTTCIGATRRAGSS